MVKKQPREPVDRHIDFLIFAMLLWTLAFSVYVVFTYFL